MTWGFKWLIIENQLNGGICGFIKEYREHTHWFQFPILPISVDTSTFALNQGWNPHHKFKLKLTVPAIIGENDIYHTFLYNTINSRQKWYLPHVLAAEQESFGQIWAKLYVETRKKKGARSIHVPHRCEGQSGFSILGHLRFYRSPGHRISAVLLYRRKKCR